MERCSGRVWERSSELLCLPTPKNVCEFGCLAAPWTLISGVFMRTLLQRLGCWKAGQRHTTRPVCGESSFPPYGVPPHQGHIASWETGWSESQSRNQQQKSKYESSYPRLLLGQATASQSCCDRHLPLRSETICVSNFRGFEGFGNHSLLLLGISTLSSMPANI